jgi:hypothetical protein
LLGVAITITPSSPLATILQLAPRLTKVIPLQMTDVTTLQPYASANGMNATALPIS